MGSGIPFREDQILLQHTARWFSETGMSKNQFSADRLIPALMRAGFFVDEPQQVDQYENWLTAKRRHLTNILNGKTNLPLAWKWLWLDQMDAPYREDALRDLMAISGHMCVPLPDSSDVRAPTLADLAGLAKEFSDVLANAAAAADGVYGPDDCPVQAQRMQNELFELAEKGLSEAIKIQQGTGVSPRSIEIHAARISIK